ncbi:hypothetical protein [Gordonia sp. NB41Y]|uniref:hypothetical protein n=1 Tax=Gordonia sp. NB41Y TaxID=875808 RepID=UPI0002BFABA6|nr:hypothetical protein [Gordonia sp. NB41Y]EMP12032.1 hypothetical protein ISGA_5144 [Gordonia sp. NB41Y]WLP92505.1 hypothetical protein Q9K23_09885 [Gordonia sp. NB41Y]
MSEGLRGSDDDTYDRGFGRYLDEDMANRPHTAAEADDERETRGQGTVGDNRPDEDRRRRPARPGDRGFGRYLTGQ